jgi:hypothetical protein
MLREQPPVFRVDHLQAQRSAAHLPEAAHARAAREVRLLAGGEMEEAQRQHSRAVGDAAEELAAAAVGDLGELHLPFHRRACAGLERADVCKLGAVLVAQRQEEQQVRQARDAEPLQARGERGAHPA